MLRYRERWPLQPWGYPLTDLRAQGAPELQRFTGHEVLLVMHVRGAEAFGNVGELLGVRVTDTGTMTAALAEGVIPSPSNYDDKDMEC